MPITLNGTTGIVSPSVTGTPVIGGLVSGTAVASTSGTSIDFTGIPSWVKRITVMFSGVSTNGSSVVMVQLGDAGGVEITSYTSMAGAVNTTNNTTRGAANTTGFITNGATGAAADVNHGAMIFSLIGSNIWTCSGNMYNTNGPNISSTGGSKTLSDTLTQVRITTVNGTDTFDAGTINIIYEG